MRGFLRKAMCAAAICAPLLAAAQQQPSDYAREKRWADEVLPSIVVGEAVWLARAKDRGRGCAKAVPP